MVQSSLKWLLGSSRRYKRLTWQSQGQLQIRLRFAVNYKSKEFITNTHICGAFCDINQTLIKSVWNYTKRHPRPFVLILWTSITPQVMKMLILLANSHCPSIIVKWILACQTTNTKWPFPYSNHPSSFKTYWLLLIRSHSSWRQKLVPTPLAVCTMQGRFGIHHKVHSK